MSNRIIFYTSYYNKSLKVLSDIYEVNESKM